MNKWNQREILRAIHFNQRPFLFSFLKSTIGYALRSIRKSNEWPLSLLWKLRHLLIKGIRENEFWQKFLYSKEPHLLNNFLSPQKKELFSGEETPHREVLINIYMLFIIKRKLPPRGRKCLYFFIYLSSLLYESAAKSLKFDFMKLLKLAWKTLKYNFDSFHSFIFIKLWEAGCYKGVRKS